ncbi:MAG TPA: hypothetical protein VMK30_06455 [Pleomorphomonadaceae bacterium]|jgi:hypothetical protein|nr:hypothetical protein [Pleomorphomonadaceae bacterium]
MFANLSANDRLAAVAAVVVIITGLISIATAWGPLVFLSLAAGVGALFVVLQPQIAPAVKLPMTKGVLLLGLGAIATVVLLVVALVWIDYILTPPIFVLDTIQFFIGVVAAVVLLYAGWRAYQAEKGTTSIAG